MSMIAEATDVDKVVGRNLQEALNRASADAAWEAIAAFDSPERARQVLKGEASAWIHELFGAAQALHVSAADFLSGV
ncbi:hypothetical protein [Leifsonia virtsii]|uniref:Uncharacterized protein n=1 Tax=Leifsonia virtsii TaxID=3035915 RepID=A0ABT8ISX9_9MICO|nr:hypothetical protein [Leifsonia virtsii]MDN4595910.1 hypothetical protein [Leifsonia virtsii]